MKKILFISLALGMMIYFPAAAIAQDSDAELSNVLSATESLFKAMKEKNYPVVWNSLTAGSKKIIVDNVFKAAAKSGFEYSKQQIGTDFEIGGLIARTYWNSYLTEFDPDLVLQESNWQIGFIKGERAELNIQYKKSNKPAVFKIYKEEGTWKVGLEETFAGRKYLLSW